MFEPPGGEEIIDFALYNNKQRTFRQLALVMGEPSAAEGAPAGGAVSCQLALFPVQDTPLCKIPSSNGTDILTVGITRVVIWKQ